MNIYFKEYSINKVSKNILGNALYAFVWGSYHTRGTPKWLNINLIKRK